MHALAARKAKTNAIGIIGLGRIGALIAERMKAFGTKVVAYDPYVTSARAQQLGVQLLSLDELIETSDFITIHMPKTPETTGMIGTAQLKAMKPTPALILNGRPRSQSANTPPVMASGMPV